VQKFANIKSLAWIHIIKTTLWQSFQNKLYLSKIRIMEKETTLSEWMNNLTISSFMSVVLLVVFALIIIILVARTFRGKSDI
jgi:hypothetical protein